MTLLYSELLASTAYLTEAVSSPGQWDAPAYLEACNWACQEAARLSKTTFALLSNVNCPISDNRLTLSLVPLAILTAPRPRCHEVVATDGEGHVEAPSVSGAHV